MLYDLTICKMAFHTYINEMLGIILTSTMMLKLSLPTTLYTSLSLPKAKSSDNRIPNGKSFIIFNPFSELVYSLVFVKIFILPAGMAVAWHSKKSNLASRSGPACPIGLIICFS